MPKSKYEEIEEEEEEEKEEGKGKEIEHKDLPQNERGEVLTPKEAKEEWEKRLEDPNWFRDK